MPLPYYGFEEVQLAVAHGPGDYADYHLDLMKIDPELPALLCEENALARSGAPASWKSAIPEQYHSSTWVADKSIDTITKFAAEDAPFFLFALTCHL